MADQALNERERRVLEAVVRNFILTAQPTGSRFLARHSEPGLSAATLRNVMSDLEEKGFITHPHTSAGRVPTDSGYRLYVDQMMEQADLPLTVREQIRTIITAGDPADLRLLMEATSRALSIATDQLGIALAPRLSGGVFRHLHIFEVEPRRYVLHMTIESGFVRTLTVELGSEVSQERLATACEFINQRFAGVRLSDMPRREAEALGDLAAVDLGVVRLFVPSIKRMLEDAGAAEVYAEGETNIVLKPEFSDRERMGAVIEILGDHRMLMHLFDTVEAQPGRVVVTIGGENQGGQFESFSVVKARYQVGGLEGTLGVLGPKRMPYPLLVAAVDYTAKLLGELHR